MDHRVLIGEDMRKGQKLHKYLIKLDKWASPIHISAASVTNAVKRAEYLFPNCDCGCGETANVTDVKFLR